MHLLHGPQGVGHVLSTARVGHVGLEGAALEGGPQEVNQGLCHTLCSTTTSATAPSAIITPCFC